MDLLNAIIKPQSRRIGVLMPDVVISEKHTDELTIAQHPVDRSASISDYAWKKAASLTVECGFSANWAQVDFSPDGSWRILPAIGPTEIYQELRDLQQQALPFQVITGKRSYQNMLITKIAVTTNKDSENVLLCTIDMQEVIFAETYAQTVADKQLMKTGNATSGIQNGGVRSTMARTDRASLWGGGS